MRLRPALLLVPALAVSACVPSAASPSPALSPPGSPTASAAASGRGSDAPLPRPVGGPEEAAEAVLAFQPELERFGLIAFDPEMIGGCCFYRVRDVQDGYEVEVEIGWGDCPAGCINRHRWWYMVTNDGVVELLRDEGDPVPVGAWPPNGGAGG